MEFGSYNNNGYIHDEGNSNISVASELPNKKSAIDLEMEKNIQCLLYKMNVSKIDDSHNQHQEEEQEQEQEEPKLLQKQEDKQSQKQHLEQEHEQPQDLKQHQEQHFSTADNNNNSDSNICDDHQYNSGVEPVAVESMFIEKEIPSSSSSSLMCSNAAASVLSPGPGELLSQWRAGYMDSILEEINHEIYDRHPKQHHQQQPPPRSLPCSEYAFNPCVDFVKGNCGAGLQCHKLHIPVVKDLVSFLKDMRLHPHSNCEEGDDCSYLDFPYNTCFTHLKNRCNGHCRYVHVVPTPVSKELCEDERKHPGLRVIGHCNYKSSCKFLNYPYYACLDFQSRRCNDPKCPFIHVGADFGSMRFDQTKSTIPAQCQTATTSSNWRTLRTEEGTGAAHAVVMRTVVDASSGLRPNDHHYALQAQRKNAIMSSNWRTCGKEEETEAARVVKTIGAAGCSGLRSNDNEMFNSSSNNSKSNNFSDPSVDLINDDLDFCLNMYTACRSE